MEDRSSSRNTPNVALWDKSLPHSDYSGYLSCCTRYIQDTMQNRMYQYWQTLSEDPESPGDFPMTTQAANSISRQKTLMNGQKRTGFIHPRKHTQKSENEYGVDHATWKTNQKRVPPLNHPAWRHDDQGRGSSKL